MQASWLVTIGMLVIPLLVAGGFAWLHGRDTGGNAQSAARRRAALALAAWMALFAALALSGVLARFELRPPPFVLALLGVLGTVLALAYGSPGTRFMGLPLAWLVAAQAFRLPLELVMHAAAREGVMPHEMSFSGYNFDIVTGTSAILVAWLAAHGKAPRWLVLGWNVLGSVLLAVVLTVAILATPMLHVFGEDPRHLNTWVAYFPFVWLPSVLVAAALFGHLVIFRALSAARAP